MSEATMRSYLVKKMAEFDAVPIESPTTGKGIPDINYTGGWIECKWLRAWPKGCDTRPVKFEHALSKEQQLWLWRRAKKGGKTWVCAKIGRDWYLWPGDIFRNHNLWDNMTRPEMKSWALFCSENGLDYPRFREVLLRERPATSIDGGWDGVKNSRPAS